MKKFLFIALLFFASSALYAQTFEEYKKQAQQEFKDYKSQQEKEFAEYRKKVNAQYAALMRSKWSEQTVEEAEPLPDEVEPPILPVANPDDAPTRKEEMRFNNVIAIKPIVEQPTPAVPIPDHRVEPRKEIATEPTPQLDNLTPATDKPKLQFDGTKPQGQSEKPSSIPSGAFKFTYYGTNCSVSLDNSLRYKLSGYNENNIADGWEKLSNEKYNDLLNDCLAWREEMQLCDWGYYTFVETLTESFFGPSARNEARLMQMYILTQSGYKVRMARSNNTLVLAIPLLADIYEYNYLTISGEKYYIVDKTLSRSAQFYVFNNAFPKEQSFSLTSTSEPIFAGNKTVSRTKSFTGFSSGSLTIPVNGNLIDFYNEFPRSNDWNLYALRSLGGGIKDVLYPQLRAAIAGKGEREAANVIISFVQRAFEYKTDDEQFGCERSLFADETFFYPYSDCEDRSILYSVLISDLLGLDVVLVLYPGHLATAVKFNVDVTGDYYTLTDGVYTVCDPTYVGAGVGMSMPQFKGSSATIVRI